MTALPHVARTQQRFIATKLKHTGAPWSSVGRTIPSAVALLR